MANKTTANFIGIGDDYSSTSGIWTLTEAKERSLSPAHPKWGGAQAIDVDFLLIAGGGGGSNDNHNDSRAGGGGAGGYITSYGAAGSGGAGSNPISSISYSLVQTSPNLTVTIGAGGNADTNGSDSVFSGRDKDNTQFLHTAVGGGKGGGGYNGSTGGSGGGNGFTYRGTAPFALGSSTPTAGTTNQGTAGGGTYGTDPVALNEYLCSATSNTYWCGAATQTHGAGGGGGAGSAASNGTSNGGAGQTSGITGTDVVRAGGGYGIGASNTAGTAGSGQTEAGGGGNAVNSGQNGTLIIRYPSSYDVSFNSSQLTGTTVTDGTHKVTTFTAGSSTISFTAA